MNEKKLLLQSVEQEVATSLDYLIAVTNLLTDLLLEERLLREFQSPSLNGRRVGNSAALELVLFAGGRRGGGRLATEEGRAEGGGLILIECTCAVTSDRLLLLLEREGCCGRGARGGRGGRPRPLERGDGGGKGLARAENSKREGERRQASSRQAARPVGERRSDMLFEGWMKSEREGGRTKEASKTEAAVHVDPRRSRQKYHKLKQHTIEHPIIWRRVYFSVSVNSLLRALS
jgi:hypothetical protein